MSKDILHPYSSLMPPSQGEQKSSLPVKLSKIILNSNAKDAEAQHHESESTNYVTWRGRGTILKLKISAVEELISFFCPEGVKKHYWLGKLQFP